MTADPLADLPLFDYDTPPPVLLADKWGVPPFSILDRRTGRWRERKNRWLSLGIQSELGRDPNLLLRSPMVREFDYYRHRDRENASMLKDYNWMKRKMADVTPSGAGTSIFDPVLCELVYRWFTNPGDRVLDPFAGGSVRGITASLLERWYTGIDLSAAQVAANEAQEGIGSDTHWPIWLEGDATEQGALLGPPAETYDLVFSCPPYADLEVYSDNPADLSTMDYTRFSIAHARAIRQACDRLAPNRFAVWVISDVRDKRGHYRGLVGHTVQAFQTAGLALYNDAVLLDPVGTGAVRAGFLFSRARKLIRMHQHVLVFLKGDGPTAARRLEAPALPPDYDDPDSEQADP